MSSYIRFCDTCDNLLKTDERCNAQLANMSIDPKFVELTADVLRKNKNKRRHTSIRCGTRVPARYRGTRKVPG